MARTSLTVADAPGTTPLTEKELTWTAADATNGNQFVHTGREHVFVRNTDGAASHNIAFTSVAVNGRQDPQSGTDVAIAANGFSVFGPFGSGWRQSTGVVYLDADDAQIEVIVYRTEQ